MQFSKVVVYGIVMALILLVPAQVFATTPSPTSTSQTTTNFKVFAIGVNYTVHELQLKASQTTDGQVIPASNFAIAPENVVQIRQGQHLMVFTSTNEPSRIEQVKITDVNNVVTDLVASPQRQGYSLQGLAAGVYVLNVIVDSPTSSNNKNAYETVLVILAPDQPPIHNVTEVTKIINSVSVQIKIINGWNNTKPAPTPPNNDTGGGEICLPSFGPPPMCSPPPVPICDENTPPGQECIDEGDPDDPPICTPDGPPCPPCPEGVEAGWCEDEDERQDFDCGDPDMENDPRCENGEPVTGTETENGSEEGEENGTTEESDEEEEEESSNGDQGEDEGESSGEGNGDGDDPEPVVD